MTKTFFFYDLETSGLDPRRDRIMQFAGQRTDMNLQPIGEPINELIVLNNDVIPSPEALMVTGITPQKTIEEGWSEVDFCKKIISEWFTPDTIVVGYNNIRFDDEFLRHLLWRNFHDPYEWSWKDGRSRWDMLDVVRMTRALRPEGIVWPVNEDGEPTNRLELLTKANKIEHAHAHDALSDVLALISMTKLIKDNQPQLFNYLLSIRDKKSVQKLVNLDVKQPFVYTSGRYDKEFAKTTVAFALTSAAHGNVLVYDLRYDPENFVKMSQSELASRLFASWQDRKAEGFQAVPVKQLQFNRSPAVAPLGVLTQNDGWRKISLSKNTVEKNLAKLLAYPEFSENIRSVFESRPKDFKPAASPEEGLYDGFLPDGDKLRVEAVRNMNERNLADFQPDFTDERLTELLLHYKARNFPRSLSESEMSSWENWRSDYLKPQVASAIESIDRLSKVQLTNNQQFILSELQLWIESTLT